MSAPSGLTLGRVAVYSREFDRQSVARASEFVAELEALGFGSLWFPESRGGREAISVASLILGATKRLVAVNAIARVTMRSPEAAVRAQMTLADAFPGRHILGLGYGPARQDGSDAVQVMADYLDEMDAVECSFPPPSTPPVRMLAAYGPKMLQLAAARSCGPHPYKVTVAFTAHARELIGPEPFLAVEQAVVLDHNLSTARELARAHLTRILSTRYNRAKIKRLGYADHELDAGGSDRLVDDMIACGDEQVVVNRVEAHLDAGADLVTLQVVGEEPLEARIATWRRLADALSPMLRPAATTTPK